MHTKKILFCSFFTLISFYSQSQEQNNKDSVKANKIITSEVMPQFPGGDIELMNFINKNKQYANATDKAQKIGIVMVTFVIEKDGAIGDSVRVIKHQTEYYDKEAIRIIKAMPKWKPGTQNGEPVRVQFNLPIKF